MEYRFPGAQKARAKYKNPEWIILEPQYSRHFSDRAWCLYSERHEKVIGYNIHKESIERMAEHLKLKKYFNRIGAEKIKNYLLGWSKEDWDGFHTMDVMEHGEILAISTYQRINNRWARASVIGDGFVLTDADYIGAFDYQI